MPYGTRASNAEKHPGKVDLPPARRPHEEVQAEKEEKKKTAAAAAAAKRASLRAVADMETKQRDIEEAERAQAARPTLLSLTKVTAAQAYTGSDEDDGWENQVGMKRSSTRKARGGGTGRGTRGRRARGGVSNGRKDSGRGSEGAGDDDIATNTQSSVERDTSVDGRNGVGKRGGRGRRGKGISGQGRKGGKQGGGETAEGAGEEDDCETPVRDYLLLC